MSNKKHPLNRKSKGQALVEFALVITILLLVIYGVLEVGRLVFIDSIVVTAAREASRYGAASGVVPGVVQYKDCAGIKAAAKRVDFLNAIDPGDIIISYDHGPGTGVFATCSSSVVLVMGDRIRVQVTADFVPVAGFVPLISRTKANDNPLEATNERTVLGAVDVAGEAVQPNPDKPVLTVVKISLGHGLVSSDPAGIYCPTDPGGGLPECRSDSMDTAYYEDVTLTATPDEGSSFAGWSGGGCPADPFQTSCTINMDKGYTVAAIFNSNFGKMLTVSKSGFGYGTVTSDPGGINCGSDCWEQYETGTTVRVYAAPDGDSSSSLTGWWVNGIDTLCVVPAPVFYPDVGFCDVTLDTDTTVEAVFESPVKRLTIVKTGYGDGTITSDPPGIDCGLTCYFDFNNGTVVTLTASANLLAGSSFTAWNGCDTVDASNRCLVGMNMARFVFANFDSPNKKTLTILKPESNTGDGIVSSNPVGIYCQNLCSFAFDKNTAVKLTATSDENSIFTGWGGACSGLGVCTVTMSTAKFVTANFEHASPPPCVFMSMTPVWENSAKTITWNIQNTVPGSNVPIDRLLIFFGGDNLQRVSLDGTAIWTGNESPVGLSIPGNGRTLAFGNHSIVFSYPKPNAIVGKNFNATLYLVPGNCNFPSTGSWTVK